MKRAIIVLGFALVGAGGGGLAGITPHGEFWELPGAVLGAIFGGISGLCWFNSVTKTKTTVMSEMRTGGLAGLSCYAIIAGALWILNMAINSAPLHAITDSYGQHPQAPLGISGLFPLFSIVISIIVGMVSGLVGSAVLRLGRKTI